MENRNQYFTNGSGEQVISTSRTFIAGVFIWMFVALLVSSLAAYIFSTNLDLLAYLVTEACNVT